LRQNLPILLVFVLVALGVASEWEEIPGPDTEFLDRFAPLGPGEEAILFAGDTNLGGSTPVREKLRREGHDWMSRKLLSTLQSADAVAFVVNLEVPVTKQHRKGKGVGAWSYDMNPAMVDGLQTAGITHVGLANNHMLDRRRKGMKDTFKHLTAAKIEYFGAGPDLDAARAPVIIEAAGARVAIVGGMEPFRQKREADWGATADRSGLLLFDKAGIPAAVASARAQADLVVAFPHWGGNYTRVKKSQRRIADRLVAADVDVIIGHHNHAAQGYWVQDGVPLLWGLGNLFFGTQGRFGHDKMQPGYGLLARMVLKDAAIDRIELLPIRINNRLQDYQPRPCHRTEARRVLHTLAREGVPLDRHGKAEGHKEAVANPYFSIDASGVGVLRVAH